MTPAGPLLADPRLALRHAAPAAATLRHARRPGRPTPGAPNGALATGAPDGALATGAPDGALATGAPDGALATGAPDGAHTPHAAATR